MPLRHSPPLADDAEAEKDKAPPTEYEASGAALSSSAQENRAQTPKSLKTLAGTPPETLNAPAVLLSPNGTPHPHPAPASAPSGANPSQESHPASAQAHNSTPRPGVVTVGGIDFHHESEAEFARLLTYYGLEWDYEPHQFPLQWREGRPVEMFRPDFYLTEYDLYIELTTMRQALVRRKNRKLRLLRALYPEINIKLLYRRDYRRLLERFGIMPEEVEAEWPGRVPVFGIALDERDELEQAQVD